MQPRGNTIGPRSFENLDFGARIAATIPCTVPTFGCRLLRELLQDGCADFSQNFPNAYSYNHMFPLAYTKHTHKPFSAGHPDAPGRAEPLFRDGFPAAAKTKQSIRDLLGGL
uniref:(northern house mosquito) hypothetical protein n=1 Tax=Culex pipiens TaxID=7175 RepID=A0A8D8G5W7_CULPI